MRELTAWVIDHTIVQLSAWQSRGVSLPVSINLAASDFQDQISAMSWNRKCWTHVWIPPCWGGVSGNREDAGKPRCTYRPGHAQTTRI